MMTDDYSRGATEMPASGGLRGVPCVSCGYDLSGLSGEGNCPECGTAVSESDNPMLLRYSSTDAIRKVHRGLRLDFWLNISVIVGALVFGVVAVAILSTTGGLPGGVWLESAFGLVFGLAILYAWWCVTTPLTKMPDQDLLAKLRRIILVALGVSIAFSLVSSTAMRAVTGVQTNLAVVIAMTMLSYVLMFAQEYCRMSYLRRLALFVPDWPIAKTCALLRWLVVIGLPVYGLMMGVAYVLDPTIIGATATVRFTPSAGGIVSIIATFGMGISALVYSVMYLVVLYKVGSRAGDALALAKAIDFSNSYGDPGDGAV